VNHLSLEAIKQVTDAEQACAQRKTEALQAAKRTVADAERAGQALLEARRSEAQTQVKAMMAKAEKEAAVQAQQVQADTQRSCDALKASAETKLDEAAQRIVRRVVNLS
jgi:V/A-type H+-transporting ATPase subunit G/H